MVTYELRKIRIFFSACLLIVFFLPLLAQSAPALFSYQGRILNSAGQGLEFGSVSFEFTITSPDGSCVIYKEQRDGVDMRNSKGLFDTPIGAGTKIFPASPSYTLLDAFSNSTPITCSGGVVYTPGTDDSRKLRVQFYDGVGWKLISPDQVIRSVPFAGYAKEAQTAAKLGTYPAANYVRRVEFPTCTGTDVLTFNGSIFSCASAGGGTGTVTAVTVASPLAVATGTTTPHITLPAASGTQNGYITSADWTTFNNKLSSTTVFAGDISGTSAAINVDKLKGVPLTFTSLSSGQYLKYNGTAWVNDSVSVSGFTGSLAGDVSGNQGSTSVNKIKGVDVSATAPTANQVLKYTGGQWTPTTLSGTDLPTGTATASGTTGRLAYFNGANSLADSILFQSGSNLGLGTSSPQVAIDVQASNAQIRAINSNSNGYATLSATTYGGANVNNSANLNLYRFRGNISTPDAPVLGDQLGVISVYGGTAPGSYTPVQGAKILFSAEEDFTATAAGTGIGFFTQLAGQAGGPTERLHISNSGTVGVGVVSSSDNLQVRGKTGFGYAGVQNGQVSFYPANVANSYFHFENRNDNTFRLSAGATPGVTELLTVTNGGFLGVGVTSPARPLHVSGPMRLTTSTTPASPIAGDIFVDSADSNKLKWYDGSTWKDAGGAAATSPTTDASALTSGTLAAARLPAFSGDVTSTGSALTLNTVTVAKGGTGATSFDANKLVATNGTGSALVSWACPLGNFIKFDSAGVAGCDTLANILGYTPANGSNYVAKAGDTMTGALVLPSDGLTVGTNQLKVSGGSVGVGVASPSAKFDVVSAATGSVVSGRFASSPGGAGAGNLNALVLDNTNGASNFKNEIKFRGSGNDKWSIGIDPAGAGEQTFYIWDAVSSARRMTIDGGGNIGVGTDSPGYRLHVRTDSASTANTTVANAFNFLYAGPSASSATRFVAQMSGAETAAPTATITGEILGQASYAKHASANPLTKLSGSWSGIYHTTNTTVGTGIAAQGEVNNDGTGTITQAVGLHSAIKNNSSGSIGTGYGLYIDTIQATNKWSVYASDATAKSYFAGKVGVDTSTPQLTFHVGGASAGAGVQTVAQFGDPGSTGHGALYLTYNHPNVTGNMHYANGWKYGGGLGKPSGMSFTDGVSFYGSDATVGAKDAAVSDIRTFMSISSQGNVISNGYSANAGVGIMTLRNTYNNPGDVRYWHIGPDGNGNGNFVVYNNSNVGVYLLYGQTSWSASSDLRLKKQILPIEDSLNKILQLNGVTYLYNKDKDGEPRKAGVIAQDVQKVLPEAVTEDNGFLAVKYTELIPLVINAVKDLAHKFMDLEETQATQARGLASVNSEVAILKKENAQLKAEAAKQKKENAAIKSWICAKDPAASVCK